MRSGESGACEAGLVNSRKAPSQTPHDLIVELSTASDRVFTALASSIDVRMWRRV